MSPEFGYAKHPCSKEICSGIQGNLVECHAEGYSGYPGDQRGVQYMSDWIKCADRMPEGDQVILAAGQFGEVCNILVKDFKVLGVS